MIKKRTAIAVIAAAVSISLVLGLFVLPQISQDAPLSAPERESDAVMRFGMTYIRVTPALSDYYDLGIESGVLVTEVIPGSPADLASVKAGDVILSCNGIPLDEAVPLLGIVRTCRPGEHLVFEVYSDDCCRTVDCCPYCGNCGTPDCECSEGMLNGEQPQSEYRPVN